MAIRVVYAFQAELGNEDVSFQLRHIPGTFRRQFFAVWVKKPVVLPDFLAFSGCNQLISIKK